MFRPLTTERELREQRQREREQLLPRLDALRRRCARLQAEAPPLQRAIRDAQAELEAAERHLAECRMAAQPVSELQALPLQISRIERRLEELDDEDEVARR